MIGYKITCKLIRQGLSKLVNKWVFWSLENDSDYYASLEDESPYYSLTYLEE